MKMRKKTRGAPGYDIAGRAHFPALSEADPGIKTRKEWSIKHMRLITVSREFGSGGRELGKRLADALGFAYYDREIITAIAQSSQFHEGYVESVLEKGTFPVIPLTFGRTLSYPGLFQQNATTLLAAQERVIEELAARGEDCVIVGRGADVILRAYQPFNLFIYGDAASKLRRCREREEAGENLTDRELLRRIQQVDAGRARYRQLLTGGKWGQRENYHLCLNTTGLDLKELAPLVAQYAQWWFGREGQ